MDSLKTRVVVKYTQSEDTRVNLQFVSHLLDVLYVVFGGHKNHRLLLRLHYVPQQMKQQRLLVIHPQMEE